MKINPTSVPPRLLCFIFFAFLIIISCSKDNDSFEESVLQNTSTKVEEPLKENLEDQDVIGTEEGAIVATVEKTYETRTTFFPPINDAHLQDDKGYDQNIVRIEEGRRTSYLMFDLSPIDSIGGTINTSNLEFTIDSDNGNGTISVFKAIAKDWSEKVLSSQTAPETEVLVGKLASRFDVGKTQDIALDTAYVRNEVLTLILTLEQGNDLAFSSKENPNGKGPALKVTYSAPQDAKAIVIEEEKTELGAQTQTAVKESDNGTQFENTDTGETGEGEASEDEASEESTVQEEAENTQEENQSETETAEEQEETSQEAFTNGDSSETDTTEEETSQDNLSDDEINSENETSNAGSGIPENEEPVAVAEASPSNGEGPLEVSFKGSESKDDKGIKTYIWDFRDGSTSYDANPVHTFVKAGTFEVRLKVRDDEGAENINTITITVNEVENKGPKAVASATPVSGEAPLEVGFNGSESTDDKAITGYFWDFKDGTKTNTANPSHTFDEPGTYEVELSVGDENGLTDKTALSITVEAPANKAPEAVATGTPLSGSAPLSVKFKGSDSTDDQEITGYFWDFKDGSSATSENPAHTFNNPGEYAVILSVKDAQGLTHSHTVNVTVTPADNSGDSEGGNTAGSAGGDSGSSGGSGGSGGSAIAGAFYVTPSGSASNNGKSESSAWSLEHAFSKASPGDVIYLKSGNYNSPRAVMYQSGTSANPIKFIGYTNSPGDLISTQGSTFKRGDAVNANKMPLLRGNSSIRDIALDLNGSFIEVHNIQITNYQIGIISKGKNVLFKNVIVTKVGEQNNNNSQTGRGFHIYGDNTVVENCFVYNSNSEGINIKGGKYCTVKNCEVYSNNIKNPSSYYILLSSGASNTIVDNCTVYRDKNADLHRGHGLVLKGNATNNTLRNSKAYNVGIEANFSGVHSNRLENIQISGSYSNDAGEYSSSIRVMNGSHDNVFKNISVDNNLYGINFNDFDDGYEGANGDENEGGNNNQFINIDISNVKNAVTGTTTQGASSKSSNNTLTNCSFANVERTPFVSYMDMNGTKVIGCTFKNISNKDIVFTGLGGSFPITFENCSFSNVGFPNPN